MAVDWTSSQKQVLESKNQDILVAAAAGSGKTAVMVQKIINIITDKENPVNIDKILAVTFTKAAAAEMKERILKAVTKLVEEDPENEHLCKQQAYVNHAQITTIDSFCTSVVRQYFNEVNVDPTFRVAQPGEITLIKSDVVDEMINEIYENEEYEAVNREKYFDFEKQYSTVKKRETINEIILTLYEFSRSYVEPEKWLDECIDLYELKDLETFANSGFVKQIVEEADEILEKCLEDEKEALEICNSENGYKPNAEIIEKDIQIIKSILEAKSYDERYEALSNVSFKSLSRKSYDCDKDLKDKANDIRTKAVKKIKPNGEIPKIYYQPLSEFYEDMKYTAPAVRTIVELVKDFSHRFDLRKRENNIVDFGDLSHMALKILVKANEDKKSPVKYVATQTAKELAKQYEFVLIDEYQDSNEVQEVLLNAVSHDNGKNNRIMVGDVKQSIYSFRKADPAIFMKKYNEFGREEKSKERLIFLDQNFRSRDEIIRSVNYIFKQIMRKEIGDVDYDNNNELKLGASFPKPYREGDNNTEFMLVPYTGKKSQGQICEAHAIAQRIIRLLDPDTGMKIWDESIGDKGGYRPARKRDIVILMRTSKLVEKYIDIFSKYGISAYSTDKTGYFNSEEIKLMMAVLNIIDNPRQDIPLATVMCSKLYEFTDRELACMKINSDKYSFYDNVCGYVHNGDDEELKNKIKKFLADIEYFRSISDYTPIYGLINVILKKTGFEYTVMAMPSSGVRMKNIDMLKTYAIQYEETSYKGLFNFIRYIEKLKKYNVDMETATDANENDDVVRIMTIHKSKGLQFPIVFISNLTNEFNEGDTKGEIVLEQKLGIGLKMKNPERMIKADTMIKTAMARKKKTALRGEELRVLYVAMTRPKEKLIMTYAYKWEQKDDKDTKVNMLKEWHNINGLTTEQIDSQTLNSTKCLGDFVSLSLARHPRMKDIKSDFVWEVKLDNAMYRYGVLEEKTKVDFDIIDAGDSKNLYDISENAYEEIYLKNPEMTKSDNGKEETDKDTFKKVLQENFSYVYPYEKYMDIKSKVSVSEIKQKYIGEIDPETEERFATQSVYPVIPEFASKEEKGLATNRGTAIHRVFELFDYSIKPDIQSIKEMTNSLLEKGLIDEETANLANPYIFLAFMQTDLYKHMKKAAQLGKLKREQQFIVGLSAKKIYRENDSDELVLVQGIIDAYYEEDGRIVIVDYKTDIVESPEELESRYRAQLQIYKMALAKITENNNIDMILYSTKFKTAIEVKKESVFEE